MNNKEKFIKSEFDLLVKHGEPFEISLDKAKLQMLKNEGLITTKEQMAILDGFICDTMIT